jgi:hypothetical protein
LAPKRWLEGDIGGLGDTHNGLVAGKFLPGYADGFDFGGVFGCRGIVNDEDLGADALWGFLLAALPLAVDVEDGEASRETGRDLVVEEIAPGGLGDTLIGVVGGAEAEVETGVDPVRRVRGMGGGRRGWPCCAASGAS